MREIRGTPFPDCALLHSGYEACFCMRKTARMPVQTSSMLRSRPVASAAIAIAVTGAAAILGAWIFQYGMGLKPCPLCLEQRYAYYFAVPLAVMVAIGDQAGASRKVLLGALVAIAVGMLWNTALGVYHSGIEWKLWAGPQECSGSGSGLDTARGLAEQLQSVNVVRCDEAPWRFLGLSLAGYNALISLLLALVAAWAVAAEWRKRRNRAAED
jgi:disulfide bond formation protein DsbB